MVGSFLAVPAGFFDWYIFILSILTTIGFQVISNFANDYGDGVKGTDNLRIGEERMVSSGKISPAQMKSAIVYMTIVTILTAIILIYKAFGLSKYRLFIVIFLFRNYLRYCSCKIYYRRFCVWLQRLWRFIRICFFWFIECTRELFPIHKTSRFNHLITSIFDWFIEYSSIESQQYEGS